MDSTNNQELMSQANPQPETSNLQALVIELVQKGKDDPEAILRKLIPADKQKLYMMAKGLMATFNLHPGMVIYGFFDKIESYPTSFWVDLEKMIAGLILGDAEAKQKLLSLLGANGN